MFTWYTAVTRVGDKLYWYRVDTGEMVDQFSPFCISISHLIIYPAKRFYPDFSWIVETVNIDYSTAVYGPVAGKE